MLTTYTYPRFPYQRPPELHRAHPAPTGSAPEDSTLYPVVVVGAGPVGMSCAIDLQMQGIATVLIDEDDTVSIGSRGVCYAKRTLEILDRLGVGEPVIRKGVSWHLGRTFFGAHEVYRFDLLPEPGHERPAMINLQQYYLEEYLQQRCAEVGVQMRWQQRVDAIEVHPGHILLRVVSPEGSYWLRAAWVVAADGARSPIRRMLGLDMEGRVFTDRFLIADVVMEAEFPAERWFWFDPPFHPRQSVLLHRQADQVWRIDFQLGWDADPEEEKKPENVVPRIQAMLGKERAFTLEWVSVYTFQCRRMARLRHGRILFAGDAAHQVSPFGARGANSGIQDAENLAWKLARVIGGTSPHQLLDSYDQERGAAADENILHSTRSTDFISPKTAVSRMFRNATLDLARRCSFAQRMVNSGRLSLPTHYRDSSLNTADLHGESFECMLHPGSPLPDAPLHIDGRRTWLLRVLPRGFVVLLARGAQDAADKEGALCAWAASSGVELLLIAPPAWGGSADSTATPGGATPSPAGSTATPGGSTPSPAGSAFHAVVYQDAEGLVHERLDLRPGTAYLIRPDRHLAARFRHPEPGLLTQALGHACGQGSDLRQAA